MIRRTWLAFLASMVTLGGSTSLLVAQDDTFTVLCYNVENLFDIDGVALFDDYKPESYGPKHLLKKLENIAQVLSKVQAGRGPDIILFQELEADQTPSSQPTDYQAVLKQFANQNIRQVLTESAGKEIRDLPVEAFLLKTLHDAGLGPYHVVVGQYRPDPTGRTVAHVNATFSRFPIVHSQTHHTDGARGILEAVHQVGPQLLHTFNNHWKSGADDPESEKIRVNNAQVLRRRLDQVFVSEPLADVIIGGDFNSHYNQSERYHDMPQTAMNDVLGSQGDELAVQSRSAPKLYNLWYELPTDRRGSDVYRGYWGTLMQMIISSGMYDSTGLQYVDNSFTVAAFENLNAQPGTRAPLPWRMMDGTAGGFSDHLPIYARFRIVPPGATEQFMKLENPGSPTEGNPSQPLPVNYQAVTVNGLKLANSLGSDAALQTADYLGQILLVQATVSGEKPFRVRLFDHQYDVWSHDKDLRLKMYRKFQVGDAMNFIGELQVYKGEWQFVVHDTLWLDVKPQ
ncbi:MAG: hypothetical protein KF752_00020 [Pirellulaceae bacterium]|nr:hypothetical protein [Pirellulaceae bacterium]